MNRFFALPAAAPKALADAGLSPDDAATMVAGHIGHSQASSPATAPAPAK